MRIPIVFTLLGLVPFVLGYGCTKHDDCVSLATCEPDGLDAAGPTNDDGGASADVDASTDYPPVPPPEGCDPLADPAASPACMTDTYALFVDASGGSDGSPGTRDLPLRTLRAAADRDRLAGRPRIYLSDATQEGNFVLPPGVSLAGGFTRDGWTKLTGRTTNIIGVAGSGPTLFFAASTKEIVVADLVVTALPATMLGQSSIGIFVGAERASFRRLTIQTGNALKGDRAAGVSNRRVEVGTGASNNGATPGGTNACTCPVYGSTTGGAGGKPGEPGLPGTSNPVATLGGRSGEPGTNACTAGKPGGDGAGGGGGNSLAVVGVLDETGWQPSNGRDGAPGEPGGGGGGAGGSGGNGGGAGGCGGCGGAGGKGGQAGGSSLGVVSYRARLQIFETHITAGDAGDGADGEIGQSGELGAAGGTGACVGGGGGTGGGGGGGGGGAAGVSAAVLRLAGEFTKDEGSTMKTGASGQPGASGGPGFAATAAAPLGVGQAGNSGARGASAPQNEAVVALPEVP